MSAAFATQQHTPPASPKSKSCTIISGDDLVEELCDCGGKKKGHKAKVDETLKRTKTFTNEDGDIVEEAGSDSDGGYSEEEDEEYSSEGENSGDIVVEAKPGEALGVRIHGAPDDGSAEAAVGKTKKSKKSKSGKKKSSKGEKVKKTIRYKDDDGNKVKEAAPDVKLPIRTHDQSDEKEVNKALFGATSVVVVQKSGKVKQSTDASGNTTTALKAGTSARPRLHGVEDSEEEEVETATETYRNADGDTEEVAVGGVTSGIRTHSDPNSVHAEEVGKKSKAPKSPKSPKSSKSSAAKEEKRPATPPKTATLTDEDGNVAIVADDDNTGVRAHAAGW